jgi:hypothetical protein
MTKETLAEQLNGNPYRYEINKEQERLAKESGLVVIFGASDDLLEFRGIIHDEIGASDGTVAHLVKKKDGVGVIGDEDKTDLDKHMEEFGLPSLSTLEVEAVWCPDELDCSWLIATKHPHASFDIMEDGELYCAGIVVDIKDFKP